MAVRWTFGLLLVVVGVRGDPVCPSPEAILPCICTNRHDDVQIWCTHSDLTRVLKGIQKVGEHVKKNIDELIIENNYLPSLPGKAFQHVKILRLMLRHNGLERLSVAWLEGQETNLVEIFLVEDDLTSIATESLMKLQNLQAITIQSQSLKRIPMLSNLRNLKYINIQSASLSTITEHTFENLPNLEKLLIQGSSNLHTLKENAFFNLPKLRKLEIFSCGIDQIHMRALALLPSLKELSFRFNRIFDATMVGRATRDLPKLSVLDLNHNEIDKLSEGAFVDQPMLESLYLSNNKINIIHHGAFHRVPNLRVVDLNYNNINRIHPESFLQQSGSGVEDLSLIGNQILHISEFRALLDALPRLKFLEMSDNLLQEIPRGALRGHPSLERLHINQNNIKYIEPDAFIAMPALRELQLSNNSLSDLNEGPFWNLPTLKGLDLSNNYFQRLEPKLLYNLPALRRLNLCNNKLNMIDPITFLGSPLLEYVNISGNAMLSIHPATFRNLHNLYELDASSNKLVEFIPGLPNRLEHLFLQRNQITSLPIPPSPDLDLPSLRNLDISSNGIQNIAPGCLKTLHNLRRLSMKRNGLKQIDVTTFNELIKLEILDLDDNQIISIHPKSFSKLSNLKQINLHGNTIENFDLVAIQENAALSTLDFSKNKLKTISPNTVKKALDVEILNISSNNLNELPLTLNILPRLRILDASYNRIKIFDGNSINNVHTLSEIRMPHNKIIELRPGSFENIRNLEIINLENNQIEIIHSKSIANLPNLLSVFLARNHIIDIPDRVFSNLPKLRVIELQGNRIQFISPRAFENLPLVQYLNISHNQLTNLDSGGLSQLSSLEVLDLSFNRLTKLVKTSFQFMEWLIEVNLDNNNICYIGGKPFDYMPRLKVLSLRNNKITAVTEETFTKLRNNIAILDIDGNPLVCNCHIIWLKSWLQESSSIGPKCTDGTYVKTMPINRADCQNTPSKNDDLHTCMLHDNEALLPNLATSQVFSSLDKIKDYQPHINNNKVNSRPSPQESEYFYDEYIDYPYNDTLINGLSNEINQNHYTVNKSHYIPEKTTTPHGKIKNNTHKNMASSTAPSSGFTFFGMPIPSLDMGRLWNTGRKIDWSDGKNHHVNNKYQPDPPKFETGGFAPILPTTAGGFMPIPNPSVNVTHNQSSILNSMNYTNEGDAYKNISMSAIRDPVKIIQSNATHKKSKTEIHELQAFTGNDSNAQMTFNRTKNVQEQNAVPNQITKYNLMETNVTITQVTEKENLLITTDMSSDMSLQSWLDTTTLAYTPSTPITAKPPIRKHAENHPSALSAVFVPNIEDTPNRMEQSKRPATITKVKMPHIEQYDLDNNFALVNNRNGKTSFVDNANIGNTKTHHVDSKEWYYKNYNNSKLEPYIAPGIHTSNGVKNNVIMPLIIISVVYSISILAC